jgi:hypothetical protein
MYSRLISGTVNGIRPGSSGGGWSARVGTGGAGLVSGDRVQDRRAWRGSTRAGSLGLCYLSDCGKEQGAGLLREALAIYQRIGSPRARQVEKTLQDHAA